MCVCVLVVSVRCVCVLFQDVLLKVNSKSIFLLFDNLKKNQILEGSVNLNF